MKKILILLLVSSFTFASYAQSRQERKAEKKAKLEADFTKIKDLIDSQNFMFEADWALPLGNDITNIGLNLPGGAAIFQGGRIDVSGNGSYIKITDNNADLFLPFFGRVFFPQRILGSRGIEYKGEISDYEVEFNERKKNTLIKFNAKSETDFFKFIMTISATGNTNVSVNSTNRQTISYDGNIQPLKNDEN